MSQSPNPTRADLQKMSVAEQHEWLQTQRSRRSMLKGGLVGKPRLSVRAVMEDGVTLIDELSIVRGQ